MAGTFSKIYIQLIFAVKGRDKAIGYSWEEQLYKYISGIVANKQQKLIAVNGMPDHIHLLIGMKPNCSLSALVREVKKSSTEFIKRERLVPFRFQWQEGFGAFSYSHSQLDAVVDYIMSQKEHHRKRTFREEYIGFLHRFSIDHQEEHLFEWY